MIGGVPLRASSPSGFHGLAVRGQAVPASWYLRTTAAQKIPVWVVGNCGQHRDCLPFAGPDVSFGAAYHNAKAWVAPNPTRKVFIYDRPGGFLLATVYGSYDNWVNPPPSDQTEAELRRIADVYGRPGATIGG